MNGELKEILERVYQYGVETQAENTKEAQIALKAHDMPYYFDLSINTELADTCWALEKWDEAKILYRNNAKFMKEQRTWHLENSGPDYPFNASSDWLASTLIKAGELQEGRKYLETAIQYWQSQPGSLLVLTKLGLHAAQAGLPELANNALSIIQAREELVKEHDQEIIKINNLYHYESAQIYLMMGQWHELQKKGREITEVENIRKHKPGFALYALENALLMASIGFKTLVSLINEKKEIEKKKDTAKKAFEKAMLYFYKFSEQVDWNLYFMRLNTRFMDEIAAGKPLNANPFADY